MIIGQTGSGHRQTHTSDDEWFMCCNNHCMFGSMPVGSIHYTVPCVSHSCNQFPVCWHNLEEGGRRGIKVWDLKEPWPLTRNTWCATWPVGLTHNYIRRLCGDVTSRCCLVPICAVHCPVADSWSTSCRALQERWK